MKTIGDTFGGSVSPRDASEGAGTSGMGSQGNNAHRRMLLQEREQLRISLPKRKRTAEVEGVTCEDALRMKVNFHMSPMTRVRSAERGVINSAMRASASRRLLSKKGKNRYRLWKFLRTISINRSLIQAIPTSLPPQPIREATKASNLQRIPPGVQGRSHFTYFLYLIVQIMNPIFLDYRVTLGFGSTGGLDLACLINRLPCHDGIQWVLGRITNSLPGVGTDRSPHKSLDT
ncbi:hypothetical protein Tco_0524397 [Tanacetum coccineum]